MTAKSRMKRAKCDRTDSKRVNRRLFISLSISLLLSVSLLAGNSFAGDTFRFGIMPMFTNFEVNDPLGPTASKNVFVPLSGILIYDLGRDTRAFVHAYKTNKFTLAASTTDVGQEVEQTGLNASYQVMYRLSRAIRPWFGIGLGYAHENYTTRHTVTSLGFLPKDQPFPVRTVDSYAGVINMSIEGRYNKDWDLGVHVQGEIPFSEGARMIRFGVYAVY